MNPCPHFWVIVYTFRTFRALLCIDKMLSRKIASIFINITMYENKADISLMCYRCQMLLTHTLSSPQIQNIFFSGVCLCPIFKLL